MTFRHDCPFCDAEITSPADAVGAKVHCPKCELGITVPEPVVGNPAPAAEPDPTVEVAPPVPAPASTRFRKAASALALVGLGGAGGFFLARQFPPTSPDANEPVVAVAGPAAAAPTDARQPTPLKPDAKVATVAQPEVAPLPRPVAPVRHVAPEPRPAWKPVRLVSATASGGGQLELQPDGSLLATGPTANKERYTVVVDTDLPAVGVLRLEALTDPSLPNGGPGRAGNFILSEIRVDSKPIGAAGEPEPVRLASAEATFSQERSDVEFAIDGLPFTGWAIYPQGGKPHAATFRFGLPAKGEKGVRLTITMEHLYGDRHSLGRFRFTVAGQ